VASVENRRPWIDQRYGLMAADHGPLLERLSPTTSVFGAPGNFVLGVGCLAIWLDAYPWTI